MTVTLPSFIEENYSLARLTTVRTGGPARYFARISNRTQLAEVLQFSQSTDCAIRVVGSGSNLLVADKGFDGLVIKLQGELAQIEATETGFICGGGARLPAVAAQAARLGLAGIEFGVNIPGTVGGAVKMNANAYGGQLAEVIEWVDVVSVQGCDRRSPADFDFAYRSSNLSNDSIVAQASFALTKQDSATVKAVLAGMRKKRREAQPSGIKTFGSTFKNPTALTKTAGQLLQVAGCNGLTVGGAKFSLKHANFVENDGSATTADILALMALGRCRVHDLCGVILEPEVQIIGDVEWPKDWDI